LTALVELVRGVARVDADLPPERLEVDAFVPDVLEGDRVAMRSR
jgi:hypothetical protein